MIFEIDWLALKETTKRDLLMIMMRARSPIQMTSVYVVTMNLKSFVIVSMERIDLFFFFFWLTDLLPYCLIIAKKSDKSIAQFSELN